VQGSRPAQDGQLRQPGDALQRQLLLLAYHPG
jgi:hypothetical protein